MNADDWQAAADIINVALAVLFLAGAAVMWRLRGSFVTREEHQAMSVRLEDVENDIASIKGNMFTNADAKQLSDKMGQLAVQNATLLGEVPGLRQSMSALANQVSMLNQHALSQAGKN